MSIFVRHFPNIKRTSFVTGCGMASFKIENKTFECRINKNAPLQTVFFATGNATFQAMEISVNVHF